MCATCGCGEADVRVELLGDQDHDQDHDHDHDQDHDHPHEHPHEHLHEHPHQHSDEVAPTGNVIDLEVAVLAKDDHLAARNREWLKARGVIALNLMSSPGAGKTTLLCRTIEDLSRDTPVAVVEGDQETRLDAERIRAAGAPVVQVNTGSGCHLDASMLADAMRRLEPAEGSVMFVENVGNLVCPALFDLGEAARVVIVSVTEGEDKPLKYPQMFAAADLVVINKIDLLPYVDVDLDRLTRHCRSVNPGVGVLPMSVMSGKGLTDWYDWVRHPLLDMGMM